MFAWRQPLATLLVPFGILTLFVCVPRAAAESPESRSGAAQLADQLRALHPSVRPDDAGRVALHAYAAAADLRRTYGPVGPPQFHNFLVNTGLKKRGLCHHWARDLGNRLAALKLRTLLLRWGIARAGTLREHNCVVVTARGQPFEHGIVLDAWRHSGRLYATRVAADNYPWKEDPADSFVATGEHAVRVSKSD